jgi:outer membrane protein assembly factor BamD
MFKKITSISFLVISLLVLFTACSKYEKLLKSDDYILKYDKAIEYYEKKDWVRSSTLIEQILPVYRGTDKAERLSLYLANSYYNRRDYMMAAHLYNTFIRDFPNSTLSEDAHFMRALCNYYLSPRSSLDQSYSLTAIDQFRLFNTRFPNSVRVEKSNQYIEELKEKLREKSYKSARLYYDMGDYKASITAFKASLNEFPDTEYREEILFLILKASYLLAENSVENKQMERFEDTVDEYYIFMDEFPESLYKSEAMRFYSSSIDILRKGGKEDLTLEK